MKLCLLWPVSVAVNEWIDAVSIAFNSKRAQQKHEYMTTSTHAKNIRGVCVGI